MSDWTFSVATPQDLAPYYDPYINNDPGFMYTPGAGMVPTQFEMAPQGGFNVGGAPLMPNALPSFNPSSVGAPAAGGPAPAMPSVPEPTPSPAAAVSNAAPVLGGAMGAGDQGKGGPATSVPGSGVGGGSAVAGRGYMPGSQSMSDTVRSGESVFNSRTPGVSGMASPAASIASTQGPASQPGAFSKFASGLGKDLLRSSMPALIGGGLNMLGSALAPKPEGPRQSPMSAPPIAPPPAAPTPGPAPMTAPESAPLPGAKWSPLLMGNAPKMGNPNLGIETEKRMKKGKNTGGMALY